MAERPKYKSTGGLNHPDGSPCILFLSISYNFVHPIECSIDFEELTQPNPLENEPPQAIRSEKAEDDYDVPGVEASTASFASLEDIEGVAVKSRPATQTRIKSPGIPAFTLSMICTGQAIR